MKKCIITLIDDRNINLVNELIKNLNDFFVENNKNVDLILFHEESFPLERITEVYNAKLIFKKINLYDIDDDRIKNISPSYYGFNIGYRMMCRFLSGIVFKMLKDCDYDYVLRLDSDSRFYELINRDIFFEFEKNDGYYGYINIQNDRIEVRTNLIQETINYIEKNNLKPKLSFKDTIQHQYNLVYYNNFEMVKLCKFTTDDYLNYFDYLDSTNGFLKYRWGDHSVRFLYTQLFFDQNNIFYFKDIAYFHHGYYKNKPFTLNNLTLNF